MHAPAERTEVVGAGLGRCAGNEGLGVVEVEATGRRDEYGNTSQASRSTTDSRMRRGIS